MRLVFVTPTELARPQGGRAMLARMHRDELTALPGVRVRSCPVKPARGRWTGLTGEIDGATAAGVATVLAALDRDAADTLWLDGSNLGRIAQAVKRARPAVRIVTFFHNVEARFFWGSVRTRRSPRSVAVLAANYVAERKAVRHSDVLVTLSERDSAGMRRLYGRGADAVAPMVLDDRGGEPPTATPPAADRYVLFVGGGFYANIAGIDWFARAVAPRIGPHVTVVGRGMDVLAERFAHNPAVTLVGGVDDLAPWYAKAMLVVAPIFDGSGMKTKVAEALMYGKHVVGTPEAFSGYADDVVAANRMCVTADDFVAAIAAAAASPPLSYDPAMRALYERDHSPAAARTRLAAILTRDRSSGVD